MHHAHWRDGWQASLTGPNDSASNASYRRYLRSSISERSNAIRSR